MRALARWGATPLLAAPLGAWAFGLGDIELQSALNQPFQAQIALVSATPEDLAGLRVALAGDDTFVRYGVDRPSYLSLFDFRVSTDRSGQPVIQVTSRQAIPEPFVTLLVEATWPRGRSVKEYTVLLDPPVLLPAPSAAVPVQPAESRATQPASPGGAINRPPQPAPAPSVPRPEPAPAPTSSTTPSTPRVPAVAPEGSYGPVQRAETLWAIADRFRPNDVSINQMMVALYQANPQAFAGNMNVLLVGAVLRMPQSAELAALSTSDANAVVRRETDAWQNRVPAEEPRLVLVPPTESSVAPPVRTPAPEPVAPAPLPAPASAPAPAEPPAANAGAAVADNAADGRPLNVESETLENIQRGLNGEQPPAAADNAAPGVDLERDEQLFADEAPAPVATPAPVEAAAPVQPAPVAAPPVRVEEPSLIARVLDFARSPVLWIGLGVAALLLAAIGFMRRRRQEPEDVTGRWEALESEVDDESAREATERMRRQVPEESIVVEEQSRPRRTEAEPVSAPETRRAARAARAAAPVAAAAAGDDTLSSQTVINLDQADPVAEADFHMAYGLYDQAAELVQKALEAAPNRRDLKLKLLEVFFVWGNKEAFLNAAKSLRQEIGQEADSDWDKVVIMGKQICPDERLFAEAAAGAAKVDVDLEAGDSPLDLAFDEASAAEMDLDLSSSSGLEFDLEASGAHEAAITERQPAARSISRIEDDSLDIGERTAAGLEAALFEDLQEDDRTEESSSDLIADSLAATQESPTIESPRGGDWSDSPTSLYSAADAPTVETPTIETPSPDSPTMETPTVETPFRGFEPPTVEQPSLVPATDRTAEIDLDDLGLDLKDIEGLPADLGDLPGFGAGDSDTREQPALKADDDLLSATGVTQVLRGGEDDDEFEQRKTAVLGDEDATMLAPSFDDGTLTGTEVLDGRFEIDESGDTSLVKALRPEERDSLDLNLDDLSAALHGADTVEQPRSSSFSHDVFGGGDTPLDLDIGVDVLGQDDPTGTEEVNPLDPQTMTEVGTKLDLARAYIDMGDPEGARSILEEVLDEGDPSQRREAQSLIDVLTA